MAIMAIEALDHGERRVVSVSAFGAAIMEHCDGREVSEAVFVLAAEELGETEEDRARLMGLKSVEAWRERLSQVSEKERKELYMSAFLLAGRARDIQGGRD